MRKRVPTHKSVVYLPGQPPKVTETVPAAKLRVSRPWACKYCHTAHRDWWRMRKEDFGRPDIVLCGKCEHTSLRPDE